LAAAQTNAFQNAFVAGLCAQIQVHMSSFQCSSIAISSISSSSGSRRLLEATSSGSVTVEYIIYTASATEVTALNQQPIIPTLLVAAVAQAYTGDAITDAEVGALTATVDWACTGSAVTCSFTIDNAVDKVYYNNQDITSTVTGALDSWISIKTVTFAPVANAALSISGYEYSVTNGQVNGSVATLSLQAIQLHLTTSTSCEFRPTTSTRQGS
jgi:hypothetical protein